MPFSVAVPKESETMLTASKSGRSYYQGKALFDNKVDSYL